MSLLQPQQNEELIGFVLFFICRNDVIFLFHALFDATFSKTSLDFFRQKTVFLQLSVFSFFLELALHGRFSSFVLFQTFFVYFELVSDAFLPHQIFTN